MTKGKKIFTWGSIILILAGAAWYFLYFKKKGIPLTGTATAPGTTATPPLKAVPLVTDEFPLRKANKSAGPRVLVVQKYLNRKNNAKIKEDGIFGSETENALNAIYKTTGVDKLAYDNIFSKP